MPWPRASMQITAGGKKVVATPHIIVNDMGVKEVVDLFRVKFGTEEVAKYVPTPHVAVEVDL